MLNQNLLKILLKNVDFYLFYCITLLIFMLNLCQFKDGKGSLNEKMEYNVLWLLTFIHNAKIVSWYLKKRP